MTTNKEWCSSVITWKFLCLYWVYTGSVIWVDSPIKQVESMGWIEIWRELSKLAVNQVNWLILMILTCCELQKLMVLWNGKDIKANPKVKGEKRSKFHMDDKRQKKEEKACMPLV